MPTKTRSAQALRPSLRRTTYNRRKCVFEWADVAAELLLIFDGIPPSVYDRRRRRNDNNNDNNNNNNNTERGEDGGPESITRCARERRGRAGLIRASVKLSDKPTAGIVYKHSGVDVILSPTQTTSVTPHYVPKFLSAPRNTYSKTVCSSAENRTRKIVREKHKNRERK